MCKGVQDARERMKRKKKSVEGEQIVKHEEGMGTYVVLGKEYEGMEGEIKKRDR